MTNNNGHNGSNGNNGNNGNGRVTKLERDTLLQQKDIDNLIHTVEEHDKENCRRFDNLDSRLWHILLAMLGLAATVIVATVFD